MGEDSARSTRPIAIQGTGANGDIHAQTVPASMAPVRLTADPVPSSAVASGNRASNPRTDELMESRLRAKAHLRVKLAAARREAARLQTGEVRSQ